MSRASETALNDLHETIAKTLKAQIDKYVNGEFTDKEGSPLPVPASLLSTATKYLNDNAINRPEDEEPDPSDELADELPDFGEE